MSGLPMVLEILGVFESCGAEGAFWHMSGMMFKEGGHAAELCTALQTYKVGVIATMMLCQSRNSPKRRRAFAAFRFVQQSLVKEEIIKAVLCRCAFVAVESVYFQLVTVARLFLLETSVTSSASESVSGIFVVFQIFQGIEFLYARIKVAIVDCVVVDFESCGVVEVGAT
jgi:hypothetical protein